MENSGKIDDGKELVTAVNLYFKLAKAIHEYFGYKEDWVTIPMESLLGYHWMLTGGDETGAGATFVYADKPFTKSLVKSGNIYGAPVYTQRFLPKWVYRTETHTLISVDTRTDGNKFLYIVDNALECKDQTLKDLYTEKWLNL